MPRDGFAPPNPKERIYSPPRLSYLRYRDKNPAKARHYSDHTGHQVAVHMVVSIRKPQSRSRDLHPKAPNLNALYLHSEKGGPATPVVFINNPSA